MILMSVLSYTAGMEHAGTPGHTCAEKVGHVCYRENH